VLATNIKQVFYYAHITPRVVYTLRCSLYKSQQSDAASPVCSHIAAVEATESTSFALSGEMTMNQLKITTPQVPTFRADGKYWGELRQAISNTSGFKRWVLDRKIEPKSAEGTLDAMVQLYLRQTLETLAY
jgi:hypothetical protein